MGLMQSAVKTYDALAEKYIGNYADVTEPMAPVGHTVTRANIEIAIDLDGNFVSAQAVGKDEPKVIIPVTEVSAGRTQKDKPHPLCDQLGYVTDIEPASHTPYCEQLHAWAESEYSTETVRAVDKYIRKNTITRDLTACDLLKYDERGALKNGKELVRWRVIGAAEPDCWKDAALYQRFIAFYLKSMERESDLCMLSGESAIPADQHPKGVVAISGNAKLISSNDSTGFTYRGRFLEPKEALNVSYTASQKAHAAIRFLVANQGRIQGGRTFICWNPEGCRVMMPYDPILMETPEPITEMSDYVKALEKTLTGWRAELPGDDADVLIAVFDAATTGRLAIMYFNELRASDFYDRMRRWDEGCCFINGRFGIQSPALYNMVNYAFGSRRDDNRIETDDRVIAQQLQRLTECRVNGAPIPMDIVRALVTRAGSLQLYGNSLRNKLLFTTCAAIRSSRQDRQKEEWKLALEPDRLDRSYQFGRLLAILEKIEHDTYGADETRETNAIRLQPMYSQRPLATFKVVQEQLKKAYYPRLSPGTRAWYDRQIAEIIDIISQFPEDEWNRALDETYLMGYYLERQKLYTKRTNEAGDYSVTASASAER